MTLTRTCHWLTWPISMDAADREVCVNFGVAPGRRRVEILDSQGQRRAGRDTGIRLSLPELSSR